VTGQPVVAASGAALERAALAALGRDLFRAAGTCRASTLLAPCPIAAAQTPVSEFSNLRHAPAWLRLPPDALLVLARRVSLQSAAATLAASIDGALLGRVAAVSGEGVLDDVIAAAAPGDDRHIPPPNMIQADGLALLAAVLPEALRRYLPSDATATMPFADADRARDWVDRSVAAQAISVTP